MAGAFEAVTRVAIEELILGRVTEGRFGYVLTKESFGLLRDDIYTLLVTSRSLKAAGDKMLGRDAAPPARPIRGAGRGR
jgi:hypothetical protein